MSKVRPTRGSLSISRPPDFVSPSAVDRMGLVGSDPTGQNQICNMSQPLLQRPDTFNHPDTSQHGLANELVSASAHHMSDIVNRSGVGPYPWFVYC